MSRIWVPHEPNTWPWHYARIKRAVEFSTWHGHGHTPEFTARMEPAGTIVRIVMVSRYGDVGITTDLTREHGYGARVLLADLEQCEAP